MSVSRLAFLLGSLLANLPCSDAPFHSLVLPTLTVSHVKPTPPLSPQVSQLKARLDAAGMPTEDISGVEEAAVHLRHLVGGRARSFTGAMPHERIFRVEFPEKAGALGKFLAAMGGYNITLFHYR